MKIIVIGLGSMGKRRIRLIKGISPDSVIVGVDSRDDRRSNAAGVCARTYGDLDAALNAEKDCACAFVSTSPLSHAAIISKCLKAGLNVFTEINLVSDGYEENLKLSKEAGRVLFLSSTFLYRKEVRFIRDEISGYGGRLNYVYHVGQYLPDWHPWENFKQFFVGDKRTNGCREIMAIELPWITKAFGDVVSVNAAHGKNTALSIDYDDNYQIILEHENGNRGVFLVDVVSPKAVRNLEVFGENFYISWDGKPTGLEKLGENGPERISLYDSAEHIDGYQATIIEDAYAAEIRAFFDAVNGKQTPEYGFEDDARILELIDRIEGTK